MIKNYQAGADTKYRHPFYLSAVFYVFIQELKPFRTAVGLYSFIRLFALHCSPCAVLLIIAQIVDDDGLPGFELFQHG